MPPYATCLVVAGIKVDERQAIHRIAHKHVKGDLVSAPDCLVQRRAAASIRLVHLGRLQQSPVLGQRSVKNTTHALETLGITLECGHVDRQRALGLAHCGPATLRRQKLGTSTYLFCFGTYFVRKVGKPSALEL